jgi:hypothetical protein
MATITSTSDTLGHHEREHGLLADFRTFWREFFENVSDPYRPEQHYMRGPGPACRAKQLAASQPRTN